MQSLITSAESTGHRLEQLEKVLDALLLKYELSESMTTVPSDLMSTSVSSSPSSSSNTFNLSSTEIVVGLLAWTSMCIGVASATKFDPFHTTMGTIACFVLFMMIVFISACRKTKPKVQSKQKRTSMQSIKSDNSPQTATSSTKEMISATKTSTSKTSTPLPNTTSSAAAAAAVSPSPSPSPSTASTTASTSNKDTKLPFQFVDVELENLNFKQALIELNKLEVVNLNDIIHTTEFLWRKCEIQQNLCHWITPPKCEQAIAGYEEALKYGEQAMLQDPTNAKAAEVLAGVVGICLEFTDDKKAKLDGMWRMLELCEIATSNNSKLYLPYHIVGRLQFAVCGIPYAIKWGASYLHDKGIPEATYEQGRFL